jgi:transposase
MGGGYRKETAKAFPHAAEVADRWHLMKNASRASLDASYPQCDERHRHQPSLAHCSRAPSIKRLSAARSSTGFHGPGMTLQRNVAEPRLFDQ